MSKLTEIGQLVRTQDNRMTEQPIFIVQERGEIASENADDYKWVDSDFGDVSAEEAKELEKYSAEHGEDKAGYSKFHFVVEWRFVTACFTQKGCED